MPWELLGRGSCPRLLAAGRSRGCRHLPAAPLGSWSITLACRSHLSCLSQGGCRRDEVAVLGWCFGAGNQVSKETEYSCRVAVLPGRSLLPLKHMTFSSPNPIFAITSPALHQNLVHPQHPFSQSSCLDFRFHVASAGPAPHCSVSLEEWRAELLLPVASRKPCPYTPIFWRSRGFFCSEEQPLSDTAPYLFWPAVG